MTQEEMLKVSKDYKAGKLSEDMIKILEEANNRSIDEVIAFIDNFFDTKKHHLNAMTITDIRKWLKKKKVSDEEKQKYAEVNKCTYEEAVKKAKARLKQYDSEREFQKYDLIFGLTEATREEKRKNSQELIDEGYAELSPDGDALIMKGDNFIRFLKEKKGITNL